MYHKGHGILHFPTKQTVHRYIHKDRQNAVDRPVTINTWLNEMDLGV